MGGKIRVFEKSAYVPSTKYLHPPPLSGETKTCKLTKNLPRGLLDFQDSRGEDLTRGRGKFRGVETPIGAMPRYWNFPYLVNGTAPPLINASKASPCN